MRPLLADAIDFPLVLVWGIIVLVPLLLFQVVVESFILGRVWNINARELWGFVFRMNVWSLLAGIPTKLVNNLFYVGFLPKDLPSYFEQYFVAVLIGTLLYFGVTLLVEGINALRWRSNEKLPMVNRSIWVGIFAANAATYLVLAPLNYVVTKPSHQVKEFTRTTEWTANPGQTVLFIDSASKQLIAMTLAGTNRCVIVPAIVRDYLVSTNLNCALYRSSDNHLYFHRREPETTLKVWETKERFLMSQAALSPSSRFVAFVSEEQNLIEVLDAETGKRIREVLGQTFQRGNAPSICWSSEDTGLYVGPFASNTVLAVTLRERNLDLRLVSSDSAKDLCISYGRVPTHGRWGSNDDWGTSFGRDECNEMSAWCVRGLGSSLRIFQKGPKQSGLRFHFSVNPGLLRMSQFDFKEVAFLPGCGECLFDAEGYIYLLNLEERRIGTLAAGERFIVLTPRYQKGL